MNQKNVEPSALDEIYWLVQDKKISPETFFNFLELFWPSFAQKNGFVFLKNQYNDEEFRRLINENDNPEYWMNLCLIDEYFSELSNSEQESMKLVKILADIWKVKLKNEFSDMNFVVDCFFDVECGDCGLTFYQVHSDFITTSVQFKGFANPIIKENKLVQSVNGLRPGIPKIRKPRNEELPK